MRESYRFRITGRVQGVGFRAATQRKALFLGLRARVCNRNDGSVVGLVTGPIPADIALFRTWLLRGPPGARADAIDWSLSSEEGNDTGSFEQRR